MSRPILYDYYRSSAAYRVRIALNLKGVDYEQHQINLAAGEQKGDDYRGINPQGFVPMLDIDGHRLTQSLSIMVYLDQTRPEPLLMPRDPADGAHVRAMALTIACDIHPLNNLRVLKYLSGPLGVEEEARDGWYRHWIIEGFTALEAIAAPRAGAMMFGDEPTIADVCLVPQMFNARRFDVPLDAFPTLLRADANASKLDAFAAAHPDRQKEAVQ
ncbi:MAG: maleylacetoacetate isomerase [Sphingomicrobium sp.]